jgi:hypothetical protein
VNKSTCHRVLETPPTTIAASLEPTLRPDLGPIPFAAALAILSLIFLYVWLHQHCYYLGWHTDDWMLFRKAVLVAQDWQSAYTTYANTNHGFNYLYMAPLMRTGVSLPTLSYPIYGPEAGLFRFASAATVVFHLAVLPTWAVFAARLCGSRLAALISTFLLATSEAMVVWTPQIDSRLVSMPFVLAGSWLLFVLIQRPQGSYPSLCFITGLLFSLSTSLHYNAVYFSGSILVCACIFLLWRDGGSRAAILNGLLLVFGVAASPAVIEIGATFVEFEGTGPTNSPIRFILQHQSLHTFPGSRWEAGLAELIKTGQALGWPIVLLALVGGVIWLAGGNDDPKSPLPQKWLVVCSLLVSLGWAYLDGSFPFVRQTTIAQPFIYLLSSIGAVMTCRRLLTGATANVCAIAVALAAQSWKIPEIVEVYETHWSLGQLVAKAQRLIPADRDVIWMVDRGRSYQPWSWVASAHPDDLVFVNRPVEMLKRFPGFAAILEQVAPIAQAPRPWATRIVRRENYSISKLWDFAFVYRARDIQAAISPGHVLDFERVSASSTSADGQAWRLFDRDASSSIKSSWEPDDDLDGQSVVQAVDLRLASGATLSRVQIALSLEFGGCLVRRVNVYGRRSSDDRWSLLSEKNDEEERLVIDLSWPAQAVRELRFEFGKCPQCSVWNGMCVPAQRAGTRLAVGEILFPGFSTNPPPGLATRNAIDAASFGGFQSQVEPPRNWCFRYYECFDPVSNARVLRIVTPLSDRPKLIVYIDGRSAPTEVDPHVARSIVVELPYWVEPGIHDVTIGDGFGPAPSKTYQLAVE